MTIKSNGGVFGRNPTYNNTAVDGTLSVADKIVHIGDEDTSLRFPAVNTFSVETNGAERLRVTTDGRLGVGTTAPNGVIHTRSLDPFNLPLRIENTGGSTTFDVRVGSGGTLLQTNGAQFISMAPNAVQSTQFLTNGNVSLLTGSLVIGTSGKGIDFSATAGTGTSELFSDYEEGTWVPVVTSSSGTITSYEVYSARYTKTGRSITLSCHVGITNNGTGSVGLVIQGLPFASAVGVCGMIYNLSNGYTGSINVGVGATSGIAYQYSGLYPVASGQALYLSLTYSE